MVPINRSGTDQRIPFQKLTLYNAALQCVQHHSEFKNQDPLTTRRNLVKMPKATEKNVAPDEEEEIAPHGSINPEEAKRHALSLDNMLDKLEEGIRASTVENIMKTTIDKVKLAIVKITPYMEETKEMSVLKAIKDTSCMALMPPNSDREEQLEAMMPVEAPDPKDVLSQAKELGDLTKEQKEQIGELFDDLELAHESLVRACSTLGVLSRSLNGRQTPSHIMGQCKTTDTT